MGKAAAVLFVASVLSAAPVLAKEPAKRERLFWPHLALSKERGERIEAIEVEMTCGRFRGMANIPDDWSVELVSPSSEVTHLRASAGHGTAMIWSLRELDGSIAIVRDVPSCFQISAKVTGNLAGISTKEYNFKRPELRLRP